MTELEQLTNKLTIYIHTYVCVCVYIYIYIYIIFYRKNKHKLSRSLPANGKKDIGKSRGKQRGQRC